MSETSSQVADPTPSAPALSPQISWLILIGVGVAIWLCDVALGLRPEGKIQPWGWRLLAIFVPTILGLMLRPLPGGAIVLLGILAIILFEAVPLPPETPENKKDRTNLLYGQALAGYGNKSVWLVLAAYFLSRGIIKTGLARRIALSFVRMLGRNTLGLSYAMVGTDTVLAAMIPSNAARVGGVILPITRSLAELYKSFPGKSAALLGSFLMITLYQCDVIACSLFYTGQASNPIAAQVAGKAGVDLSYAYWFLYASVPALTCLLLAPWLISKLHPPELKSTPEAVEMAKEELEKMGPPQHGEWIMMAVFACVCSSWILTGFLVGGKYITLIALSGAAVLFVSGVLTWEDAISERRAWDVFIWYGGLVQMGTLIGKAGVTKAFAGSIANPLQGVVAPYLLFLILLLVFFYAHYAFASITAHILSMFPAFVGILLAIRASTGLGPPTPLVMVAFAYSANLCAGLTHYGTTPGPIIFSTHYVSQGKWWKVGFVMSLVNLTIFGTVGMAWWKICGLW